ncbi:MAG: TonB family protein [Rikenellaceae bacterium]
MDIIEKIFSKLLKQKPRKSMRRPQGSPKAAEPRNDSLYQIYRALPFKKRRMNFADWVYKNKIGVSVLVFTTLALFFIFVTVRFEVTATQIANGFFIEAPPEEEVEEIVDEELTQEQFEQAMMEQVQNAASNSDSKLDAALRDDRGTDANELYKEAQALQDRLNAAKNAYNQGLQEADAIQNSKDKNSDSDEESSRQDVKINGLVTVEYKLDGRNASHLPVPAYKCENAGKVVVNIVVNNNGNVIDANINTTSSKKDECLNQTALSFAKQTRFEIGTDWPAKHKGTITYLFLQQ